MDALWIVIVTFVGYVVAYHTYGRLLAKKIFRLRPDAVTPAKALHDGVDFVPTRKGIIFGHHYASIAGTGPIVGPAIGIIWGWLPALVWVFVGSIVMGAVHDFGSLVVSLRNEGKSISEITARYINPRVRTIFFLIVFLALLIVIAIFGVVIAFVFSKYKQAVLPIWGQIPIAMLLGMLVYRWRADLTLATLVSVAAMYGLILVGQVAPLEITASAAATVGLTPTGLWVLILLVYVYFASTLPVTVLLQPRDYINAWQLFIAMALLVAGIAAATFSGGLPVVAPVYNPSPSGAPPIWPFLCITIACGAISGFHSLVASGTTAKQLRRETDALFVGYGSMLLEGALAVLVIVAVSAGIGLAYEANGETLTGAAAWDQHYASWTAAQGLGSKIDAFVTGSANMLAAVGIPAAVGVTFIGVFVASFAGTTLDTATRIQRYVFSELATSIRLPALANRWVATAIVVVAAGALAFTAGASGTGALTLWPMFGAVNQLLAALALLVVTIYLRRRGSWGFVLTLLPCLFMLAMTVWAMVSNEISFITKDVSDTFPAYQKWTLTVVNALTLLLALAMAVEAFIILLRGRDARNDESRMMNAE
ncbi:MAG: carbon starvation CstA family protein [Planctomycetota bacterium]|jgi:carbon starvation protein